MNQINNPTLGDLADPNRYTDPIELDRSCHDRYLPQLRTMLVIRLAEEKIGNKITDGSIRCPCHLGIGQEAVAVGVSDNLRKSDRIFGGHRSHSHYLALGGSLYGLLAEILGKEDGCSRGMGGSMHLYDAPNGFLGSVPIVAGTVPLAVGAALASQKENRGNIGVGYFGDGAAEEGVIHESMNFASNFKLPMLFVCENNFFSSHLHIGLRQPGDSISRYAAAHGIPFEIVDGNDVRAVSEATKRLVSCAREGSGPGFLEAVTYRWRGHVGPREDTDVGVKRKGDLHLWKKRDPILRLSQAMVSAGILSEEQLLQLKQEVFDEVERAWTRAEQAAYPPLTNTLEKVYQQELT